MIRLGSTSRIQTLHTSHHKS